MLVSPACKMTYIWQIDSIRSVSPFCSCMLGRPFSVFSCAEVCPSPYIAAELPANLLLRKIGPNILMPTLLTLWGIILTLQGKIPSHLFILLMFSNECEGFVTSYEGLATSRAFLGLAEGSMFPCIVLYTSGFYTREELSLRYAENSCIVKPTWPSWFTVSLALLFSSASVSK